MHAALVPPEVSGSVQGLAAAGHNGLHLVEDLAHSGQDLLPGLDCDTRHFQTNIRQGFLDVGQKTLDLTDDLTIFIFF